MDINFTLFHSVNIFILIANIYLFIDEVLVGVVEASGLEVPDWGLVSDHHGDGSPMKKIYFYRPFALSYFS